MKRQWPATLTIRKPAGDRMAIPAGISQQRTWMVCGLLFLATVLNYLDRQVLSLTAEHVMAEFHLDQEHFGEIVSSFRYSYAAVQLFGGWLVDAAGPRLVFPLAVGLWSAAGICTGWSQTISGLRGCRFALGVGEALNWPCALKTTEQLLEPRDRAFANGIFNGGTAIGAMIAPVVVTILVRRSGWRSPFLFTGALGGLWVLLWAVTMRGQGTKMRGRPIAIRRVPSIMATIARRKEFSLLVASAVIINGVSYFLADWIPLYLKTDRGFGFAQGNALSILVYAGLDSGNLLTGYFVRRAMIRGASIGSARNVAPGASCVLMSCAPIAGFTPWRFLALACIALTAVGVAGFLVIYLTTVQDVDPLHVGTTAGMLGGVGNLVYGMLAPWIGRLSDLHHTAVIFSLIGVLPWVAYLCIAPVIREQSYVIRH
jgi:MFS transporter, ACS family, hexuronate transporter